MLTYIYIIKDSLKILQAHKSLIKSAKILSNDGVGAGFAGA